jgi:hypothetical protein
MGVTVIVFVDYKFAPDENGLHEVSVVHYQPWKLPESRLLRGALVSYVEVEGSVPYYDKARNALVWVNHE